MINPNKLGLSNRLFATAAASAIAAAIITPTSSAVVPNDNTDSEEIIDDETDVTGVGMFFRADGFVCSGSLINPRTVLFAAHCVNDVPDTAFGTSIPAAWSFQTDALPGFQNWFANDFQSNPDLYVYNSNQIIWHPDSVNDAFGLGFIEADVAISSLDTPASDIPTWALLFSPLPTPDAIDPVTGTGYHVVINGYGGTGTGTDGDIFGVDFRRRAAENMLGALASLDQRDDFLFGPGPTIFPQVLYQTDFDDPNETNPFDINIFRDEALPNEGTTAGGDSGGPLILDAANNTLSDEDLVLGVLSGGSRFFGPQSFSSYGTTSFYQPLFLYWDWIAANNPYRYVGANAGDGNWEDGDHWVSLLDPNYRVIDSTGAVINGVPDAPGAGPDGDEPSFGQVCVEFGSPFDECQDLSTGEFVPIAAPTEGSDETSGIGLVSGLESGRAQVSLDTISLSGDAGSSESEDSFLFEPDDAAQVGPFLEEELPDPTIDNGLAGATGFVPSNVDPDQLNGVNARYFDVTLSEDGTTTLSSMVEIDKLTISGAGAGLDIASTGSLTSLIDVTQATGSVNVDGMLITPGDYLLMTGLLSGSGTIQTPFLTNVAGGIAPGGMGTIGTLTVDGSVIMSSGSVLAIDINGASSDTLAITGDVSFGGTLGLMTGASGPQFGQSYTVATFGGEASDGFDSIAGLTGVLQGEVSYTESAAIVEITAGSFLDVLPATATAGQTSFGRALDRNRDDGYTLLGDLYRQVDPLESAALSTALTEFSPNDTLAVTHGLLAHANVMGEKFGTRLEAIRGGSTGYVRNFEGRPIQVASSDPSAGFSALALQANAMASASAPVQMKTGWGMFADLNVYKAENDSDLLGQDADYDGLTLTFGLDHTSIDGAVYGVMVGLNDTNGDLTEVTGYADQSGLTAGFYLSTPFAGFYYDAFLAFGVHDIETQRTSTSTGARFRAEGETSASSLITSIVFGREFQFGETMKLTPEIGVLSATYDVDGYTESGDEIALVIDEETVSTVQLSAGGKASWMLGTEGQFRPSLGAKVIYDAQTDADIVVGRFAAIPQDTGVIRLSGSEATDVWGEIEAALDFNVSSTAVGSLGLRQSVGSDLSYTILGADVKVKF